MVWTSSMIEGEGLEGGTINGVDQEERHPLEHCLGYEQYCCSLGNT